MAAQKNEKLQFNKKWLLIAVIPLVAAVWGITTEYSSGYYHNPLSISPELAANFGEVRENHFHMGLDIRTNGKENLPVYAAADGFISKVTIEEAGFGKAIYITHPNGTTTVYAHLNHFIDALEKHVRDKQYREECWQQNIDFSPGEFIVKKGQRIALSGNTGASEGPHLHFEIRDTHTGNNLNPLLKDVTIADHIPPVIKGLYWYNRASSIYNERAREIFIKNDNSYYTTQQKIIEINNPQVSFGIDVTDKNMEDRYRLGIYKAQLYMDGSLVTGFVLNDLNYANTRYVNACIDYSSWISYGKCIQLLSQLPGNHVPIFIGPHTNGIINLEDRKIHRLKITVSDVAGNIATLQILVQYDGSLQKNFRPAKNTQLLLPGKTSHIETHNAILEFSGKAVYDTVLLHITEEPGLERNAASQAIFLHDATIPIHDSMRIKIRTTLPVNDPLRQHTVMQLTNEKHCIIVKGKWKGNYMEGYFMEMGTVQLMIDTVAPDISLQEGDNSSFNTAAKTLHILYKDNMGEPGFFRAELDGHWILFEKKGSLFTYYFDKHCAPGVHSLRVIAGDKAGNVVQQRFTFKKE